MPAEWNLEEVRDKSLGSLSEQCLSSSSVVVIVAILLLAEPLKQPSEALEVADLYAEFISELHRKRPPRKDGQLESFLVFLPGKREAWV